MEDFERWLIDELQTQTLTDELKNEILERVRDLHECAYREGHDEGYADAKHEIIEHITFHM